VHERIGRGRKREEQEDQRAQQFSHAEDCNGRQTSALCSSVSAWASGGSLSPLTIRQRFIGKAAVPPGHTPCT
jgi:hypothetical protein